MSDDHASPDHIDELYAMPEFKRIEDVRAFDQSRQVFYAAAGEFLVLLESACAPEVALKLFTLESGALLDALYLEVLKKLQNFLAASKALVDHARAFYERSYRPLGQLAEYEDEVLARFAKHPPTQFVHGLRNYVVHVGLPDVGSRLVATLVVAMMVGSTSSTPSS